MTGCLRDIQQSSMNSTLANKFGRLEEGSLIWDMCDEFPFPAFLQIRLLDTFAKLVVKGVLIFVFL